MPHHVLISGASIAGAQPSCTELALAYELLTWTQLLAWPDQSARTWEPKRLRLRLLAVAARLITTGRRRILRLSKRWPWADLVTTGHKQLAALA